MKEKNMKFLRFKNNLRCFIGLHQLRAFEGQNDGINVRSRSPYGKPGPNTWRICDWCGARWIGVYDGIEPRWVRSYIFKS